MTPNELAEDLEGAKLVILRLNDMIRQQQAEIEALKEPKIPLLEQEIKFILGNGQCWQGEDCSMPNLMYIIRAVEAAHGIGVKQDEQ
jgi:hypothetical protein